MKGGRDNALALTRSSSQCVDHASIDRSSDLCDPEGLSGHTRLAPTLHNKKETQTESDPAAREFAATTFGPEFRGLCSDWLDTRRADTFTAVGISQCVV